MLTGIVGWLLVGLAVGVAANLLLRGRDPGGIVATIVLGLAGALVARYLVSMLRVDLPQNWQPYAAAALGAAVPILLYRAMLARRT